MQESGSLPLNLDLERRVVNFLAQKHRASLRAVSVEANDGTVVLRGELQTFYEKQLCLNVCQRVAGVVRLVDQLNVANVSA